MRQVNPHPAFQHGRRGWLVAFVLVALIIVAALPNRGFHNFGFAPLGIAGVALVFSGLPAGDGSA